MIITVDGQPINVQIDDDSQISASDDTTISVTNNAPSFNIDTENTNVNVGQMGLQGPQGPPGPSSQSYVHNQTSPSNIWNIVHNLGIYPNIVVEDTAGTTVEGDIEYVSANEVKLTFSGSFSGTAYLS